MNDLQKAGTVASGILMLVIGLCVFRKWKDRFILYI